MPIRYLSGLSVDFNVLVVDAANDRVGIGTTAPVTKLHVAGEGNVTGGNIHMGNNTDAVAKWTFLTGAHYNGATNPSGISLIGSFSSIDANAIVIGGAIYEANPATNIQFWTHTATTHNLGGSERMRITTNGNVLIGTTTDSGFKLDVNGVSGVSVARTNGTNADALILSDNLTGVSTPGFGTRIEGKSNSGNVRSVIGFENGGTGTNNESQISFYTQNIAGGLTNRMTIGSLGVVRLTSYGAGTITGTPAFNLAVDSSGNIIETAGGVVDGSGTANFVTKWQDANTVTNSIIRDDGTTVGVGTAPAAAKLTVDGSITAGGQTNYGKSYGSIDTTGQAVAGLIASTNGQGSMFTFTCRGGGGEYQRVVYSCYNDGGTWYTNKVIDEGTNALDVTASANGATITFTFKARSTTQAYTPAVLVQQFGSAIDTSYL